ncbi:MAG: hypothetical protein LBD94_00930 [Rickettsiales bacterium]|jgi:hypothetical protein|nr:hypothetical protein [Rickettsiales bacterium]
MDYPQRFFSRMFAWGRPLETARRFAIYSGIVMLLIIVCAGALVWARRSQNARPYFLYINGTGEWSVYSERKQNSPTELPWYHLIQESIAVKFTSDYFNISKSQIDNENVLWCKCANMDCDKNWNQCKLCCGSDSKTFNSFFIQILPRWREKFENGEVMEFINIFAKPMGTPDEKGGLWKITGDLISNKKKKIIAFVKIGHTRDGYQNTLGFHVSEFNFYEDK